MTESSDNVFVGDLPLESTVEGIKAIFAAYGTVVQARVLQPKRPGQKASALVRFNSIEEATWVVQNLNGNLAEGLTEPIVVRFANAPGATMPPQQVQMGQPNGYQQQMGQIQQPFQAPKPQAAPAGPSDNLFVGNLPAEITQEQVQMTFAAYGTIVQCRAIPPKAPGGKSSALIRFSSVEEASWVVANLNGNLAEGLQEPCVVRFANAPGTPGAVPPPAAAGGYQQAAGYQQQPMSVAGYVPKPQDSSPPPSDNLFIGNLPAEITMEQVQMIFSAYGTIVQCRTIPPKGPGGKSSALIRFSSLDEASWVVANLNGNLAEGLTEPCVVRFANAPGAAAAAQPGQQGGFQLGGAPAVSPPSDNLFVGDLPAEITTEQVQMIFSAYGSIVQCRAIPPKMPGGKSSALIRFSSVDEATWVVNNLNGNLAEGLQEPCIVRFSRQPGQTAAAGAQGWQGSYGAAQNFGQGKGAFRSEPYGGLKFPKKPGTPESFRSYFSAIRKAGVLGDFRVSEEGQVYVNNLPPDTTDHDLYKLFSAFGPIMANGARAMLHPDGTCKGFGFVDFLDPSHAQAAIAAISEFALPDGSSIAPSIKVVKKGDPNAAAEFDAAAFDASTYGGV